MKKRIFALSLAAIMTMTGCSANMADLMGVDKSETTSATTDTVTDTEIDFITGNITTSNILEDIAVLDRLMMPANFVITMTDSNEIYGDTSITMKMNMTDTLSKATFTDFTASNKNIKVEVPDFELYMGNDYYYISESAMSASTTLTARMSMLLSSLAEDITDEKLTELVSTNTKMQDGTVELIKASDKQRYVKLDIAEAASVPAIMFTPVSTALVSGFFVKDTSMFRALFNDKLDKFCTVDANNNHMFKVDKSNASEFFDLLLSLSDSDILMLVMMDSYDDMLWSSITNENWSELSGTVQVRIDAYKNHWTECKKAVEAGELDYKYELMIDFRTDKDFDIVLTTDSIANGAKVNRHISVSTVAEEKIELPAGDKIMTPEQWEADIELYIDTYLGEFKTEESETTDAETSEENSEVTSESISEPSTDQ